MYDETIHHFIENSKKEKGSFILLSGDFNEPSHLDWSEKTKDLCGPSKSIIRSVRTEENCSDRFVTPLGVWPTDHKAVMVTFYIK